ncbi:MAG: hypothetical protein A3K19_11745 [Lentisphaerae bacterium RIFOXYB12_FULL_65_16]|nr:MAG: hypothetical protein A3K18_23215 [Lentisphaerae bacterium RIFOXYA12_64_32]OGV87986.1 MAG: hypothetical protein A3K19_11745 [Lentisphaerae bacterium RIFOXYB12_FULL_65_16]
MTFRSTLIGLTAAAFLALYCYFSDHVVRASELVGNLMPPVVYGGLLVLLLLAALLARVAGGKLKFSGKEIAAVVILVLCACGIPGRLAQSMPSSIMLPQHDVRTKPGWRQERVVDLVPKRMLPDVSGEQGDRALNGFITGLALGDRHIRLSDVPWSAWARPLLFWSPLLLLFVAATFGLAAVFHRQWSQHEQLPYPISVFTHALIADDDQNGGSLFRNRMFWIAFAIVFLIELDNYACLYWPNLLIPVSLRFDFTAAAPAFETLVKGKGAALLTPQILFPVIGLAYFLASDISLSMAVGPWIYCCIAGVCVGYGVELRPGREMALSIESFLYSGGYFGILVMVLYTGRHYYWNTLRRGVGLASKEEIPDYAVWGMRLFLVCALLAVLHLVTLGLAWYVAALYLVFAFMVYVVVSRIIAETGAFMIGTFVFPGVLLWGLFGAACLGPQAMVTLFMLCTVLMLVPGRAPMAFVAQAFKLAELSDVSLAKALRWGLVVLVLALALAIPSSIYWQYDRGTPAYGYPRIAATYPFENTVEVIHKLKAQGLHEQATQATGVARLASIAPSWPHLAAFAIAAFLAMLFGAGRLFFRFWPLHPVIFLFLGGSAAMLMAFSFGLGWLIKVAASRYGGARLYQRLKPLMIGLIAGSMAGQFVPLVVGTLRYLILGQSSL